MNCPHCKASVAVENGASSAQCPSCRGQITLPTKGGTETSTWFYAQDKRKHGPVSWRELRGLAASGQLASEAMLLREGTSKWVAASSMPDLLADENDHTVPFAGAGKASAPVKPPVINGYEVLGELGRGGMGVVYKARQLGLNRIVALKMILAGEHAGSHEQARFRAEAGAVARLHHPNIVQVYDTGEQDGRPYFSLEFVDGGSLDRKLAGTPLPPRDAARLVQVLARGVQHAHEHGIIHRDLKPANVLLKTEDVKVDGQPAEGESGHSLDPAVAMLGKEAVMPKITDFGLAKHLEGGGDTRSGAILGTPGYVAPEQAAGRTREVGPVSDVYALGAILYEALTGGPPFRGETPMDTLMLVVTQEPVPPTQLRPKLPRDLETICLKCLSKSPSRRYGSAAALADDLGRFLNGEPILARPANPFERTWRWARRYPVAAAALVGMVLLLGVVSLGALFGFWHLSHLSAELVRSTAIESAEQETEVLEELNSFYSSAVVERVKPFGVQATHDYATRQGSIPLPATLTIDLGDHIREKSPRGMQVRLYSDHPFLNRSNGGPRDPFEKDALERLRADPKKPIYRFEKVNGRTTLRYATARTMKASCVKCHNEHPESSKHDWKVGDVRGVMEVFRPLDRDEQRTEDGLRGTYLLIGATSLALLTGVLTVMAAMVWLMRRLG
jgi:serine/threonine protein kinase